jgi:hypothetical protein
MKICYCLASSGEDWYPEMTFISASCVRRLHRAARITILMDVDTYNMPIREPFDVRGLADHLVRVEVGLDGPAPRSRFLKTSMRQLVDGAFLFLDSDTLPIRPFREIFETTASMSAAFDRNIENPEPHFPEFAGRLLSEVGWTNPLPNYYNAGVIHFSDQDESRALGVEWHRRWRLLYERFREHRDQPALNSAIHALDIHPRVFPIQYNAMVGVAARFAHKAKIFHFYTSSGKPREGTLLDHLVKHMFSRREIDWRAIDTATRFGAVWAHGFRWEFGMGHYARAAQCLAAHLRSRIIGLGPPRLPDN